MKFIKKLNAFLLAVTVLLSAAVFGACDGGNAIYQVKVVDAQGNPCNSGIIVKFMQSGNQVAMQPVDENGVVEKELAKGEYTVELVFTDDGETGHYDEKSAVLSAGKTSVEIVLMNGIGSESSTLSAKSPLTGEFKEYTAYYVDAGSTYISVEAEERNYYLFVPTESGTYEFSVDNNELILGYYGSPFFVQNASAADVTDNKFTISVSDSNIGTDEGGSSVFVIGIDGISEATNCVLTIERIGDPAYNVADEPWTAYETKCEVVPFTLELGASEKLVYVDITGKTDDYQFVYNETDGYYHLGTADGPVIYVDLGETSPYVSLETMILGNGTAGGAPIRKYFFDDNGDFVKKEDYTSIMTEYFSNMDQDLFVYPLNDDLIYIIQNGCSGWWDATSPDYIFEGCNPELGWMFACCYVG